MKLFRTIILCGLLPFTFGYAAPASESTFMLSGTVKDRQTGKPIPDANIVLTGSRMGTVSLENGQYFIQHISPATYDVEVNVIGYRSEKKQVSLDKNNRADFYLTPRPVPFNPVLVTATRSLHLQSEVTACSEVITREQFHEKNGDTAGEILESVGNVLVKDNGGFAGLKTLSIRGSSAEQVLVLLDGQRLNTTQSGGVDVNSIPAEAIDRIEIVRGGHSALMGTDAVGGTVHLITRNPDRNQKVSFGVGQTVGSFRTSASNAFGSFSAGPSETFISLNHLQSSGSFPFTMPDEKTRSIRKNNDIRSNSLFIKSRMNFESAGSFQLIHQLIQSSRGTADPVNFESSFGSRKEFWRLTGLSWQKQMAPAVEWTVHGRSLFQENRYKNLYENDRHRYASLGVEAQIRWMVSPAVLFQSGIEWGEDRLKSTKGFLSHMRTNQSVYAELEMTRQISIAGKMWEWKWIPAVRNDRFTHFGFQTCPKLGMFIRTGKNRTVSFRANLGKSFRAPTFDDLYWPKLIWPGGGWKGNPDLRPETSLHYDVGFSFQKSAPYLLKSEFTFFQNHFDNMILWQPDTASVWAPENIKACIIGVENRWTFRSPDNRFYAELAPTWIKAVNQSSQNQGKRLLYRPDWKIDAGVGLHLSPVYLNLQVQHIGKRYTSLENSTSLTGYELTSANIGFNRKIGRMKVHARLQISNLFNTSVYSMEGYPLPGREYRLSVDLLY